MVSTSISFRRPATGSQWVQIISEFAIIYFYLFAPLYFHEMFLKLFYYLSQKNLCKIS